MKAEKEKGISSTVTCPLESPADDQVVHPCPWLLVSHGESRNSHALYSISEDRYYVRSIPQLCNKLIRHSSPDGWLVLEDMESRKCSLFHMVSTQVIELPQLNFEFTSCILSFPPSNPDCHVVFFNCLQDSSTIYYCKPGDSNFCDQDIGIDDHAFELSTALRGKIYGITLNRTELLVLDLGGPRPDLTIMINETIPMEEMIDNVALYLYHYLVEHQGELFLVVQTFMGSRISTADKFSIFRADLTKKTRIKVQNIGETSAIFLTPHGGMCHTASTESGIEGNTVYFVTERNRCLYSFNLQDQSFSIYPPLDVSLLATEFHWITMDVLSS